MIKLGILGYAGSIGSRHGKNLMWLGHQVIGYDPAIPGKHTREQVLEQSDAVIICTPTREHFRDMMDARGKHIFVEKPIAFDAPAPAVRGFCHAKSSSGQVVAVGNNLRFHHCVMETKKMLARHLIGEIGWAEFWVLQNTDKDRYLIDGVSRNWGAHEIDLALYLLGPGQATEVIDVVRGNGGNDVEMKFSMKHENGALSTIHMDYLTEPEKRGYKLVGSKGVIEVNLVARTVKVSNLLAGSNVLQMKDTWDGDYLLEMQHFLQACANGQINKDDPLASGLEGADTLDVILSVRSMAGLVDKELEK
jgi:predicted dehydrogenase